MSFRKNFTGQTAPLSKTSVVIRVKTLSYSSNARGDPRKNIARLSTVAIEVFQARILKKDSRFHHGISQKRVLCPPCFRPNSHVAEEFTILLFEFFLFRNFFQYFVISCHHT